MDDILKGNYDLDKDVKVTDEEAKAAEETAEDEAGTGGVGKFEDEARKLSARAAERSFGGKASQPGAWKPEPLRFSSKCPFSILNSWT